MILTLQGFCPTGSGLQGDSKRCCRTNTKASFRDERVAATRWARIPSACIGACSGFAGPDPMRAVFFIEIHLRSAPDRLNIYEYLHARDEDELTCDEDELIV